MKRDEIQAFTSDLANALAALTLWLLFIGSVVIAHLVGWLH